MLTRQMLRTVVLVLAVFAVLVVVHHRSSGDQLDLLFLVQSRIMNGFVEEPDAKKITESAAEAMVQSLGDPYSVYITPEQRKQFDESLRGQFSGIGAVLSMEEDQLTIQTPMPDSPALKAGIKPGDVIVEVDGQPTKGWDITKAVEHIKGEDGTIVELTIRRGEVETFKIKVPRGKVVITSLRGLVREQDGQWRWTIGPDNAIAYMRLEHFWSGSTKELYEALTQVLDSDVKGIILDLRGNPGGQLGVAVEIASMFLPEDALVVTTRGRTSGEHEYRAFGKIQMGTSGDIAKAEYEKDERLLTLPMVVLIDNDSASASEILSGALSDNGRAFLVGTRTFGKGSVQDVIDLGMGKGILKLTSAYFYIPSGRKLHKVEGATQWGVDPSNGGFVPMTREKKRKHRESFSDAAILGSLTPVTWPESIEATWVAEQMHDPQLAAGMRALTGWWEEGGWPRVGGDAPKDGQVYDELTQLQNQQHDLEEMLKTVKKKIDQLQQLEQKFQSETSHEDQNQQNHEREVETVQP